MEAVFFLNTDGATFFGEKSLKFYFRKMKFRWRSSAERTNY